MTEINSLSQLGDQKARALKQTLQGPVDIAKGAGESIWGVLTLNGDKIKDGAKSIIGGAIDVPLGLANMAVGTIKHGEYKGIFEKSAEKSENSPMPQPQPEQTPCEALLADPSTLVIPD